MFFVEKARVFVENVLVVACLSSVLILDCFFSGSYSNIGIILVLLSFRSGIIPFWNSLKYYVIYI